MMGMEWIVICFLLSNVWILNLIVFLMIIYCNFGERIGWKLFLFKFVLVMMCWCLIMSCLFKMWEIWLFGFWNILRFWENVCRYFWIFLLVFLWSVFWLRICVINILLSWEIGIFILCSVMLIFLKKLLVSNWEGLVLRFW